MVQVVADQVRLWQADTQRVKYYTSTLYHDFPRPEVSVHHHHHHRHHRHHFLVVSVLKHASPCG